MFQDEDSHCLIFVFMVLCFKIFYGFHVGLGTADDTSSILDMAIVRDVLLLMCVLLLWKYLQMSLEERIRQVAPLKLRLHMCSLDRAKRVAESFPAGRFRLLCLRMFYLVKERFALFAYHTVMPWFRRCETSFIAS